MKLNAIFYALYFVPSIQSANVYTLAEQQATHYDAALEADNVCDVKKSIRIFEYLTQNMGTRHPAYPYTVCNLGILYTKQGDSANGIKYGNIALKFDVTNMMAAFILGYNLYYQKQLYDSFMVFRGIKDVKTKMRSQYDAVISYNLGICLYKLGGKGGDVHFQNALESIGLQIKQNSNSINASRFQKYSMARRAEGVRHTIDMGPLEGYHLFSITGDINTHLVEDDQQVQSPRIEITPSDVSVATNSAEDVQDILQYYFTSSDEQDHPTSAPLPPPHKIGKHIDHFEDYFSHQPRYPKPSTPEKSKFKQPSSTITRSPNNPDRLDIIPKPLAVAKRPGLSRFYTTS
jgi:hypothetical protein